VSATVHLTGAPIVIRKSVDSNPSITIHYSNVSPTQQREIESMILASNWFSIARSGNADYTLEIRQGQQLGYILTEGHIRKGIQSSIPGSNERERAKFLVDSILNDAFNLPPLCRTRIAFSMGRDMKLRNIYLADIDGQRIQQVSRFKSLCVEPGFFPDGKSVAYSKYNKASMDIVQTNFSPYRSRRLSAFAGLNTGAAISPNGKMMALILSKDKQVELYLKAIESQTMRRLTYDKAVEASPCFSPDGKWICYLSDASGRPELYICDLNGRQKQKLPSVGREALTPDWSTDNKIVYVTRIDGDYRLAILDMKNKRNELVPNLKGRWESPSWASDNRHIVCSQTFDGGQKSSLFIIDTFTGRKRQLFRSGNYFSTPNWSKKPVE
jgi:TolB protein